MSIGNKTKNFFTRRLEKYHPQRIFILVGVIACCCLAIKYWYILDSKTESFLKFHQNLVIYIIVASIALGFLHASYGKAKDQHLYLFKTLGPSLASPLTTLTYGIVINSTLGLIYIVSYDTETILKYGYLDKTTISYTLLLLLTWSVFGLVKIIMDVIKKSPKEKMGQIISGSNTQSSSNTSGNVKPGAVKASGQKEDPKV